MSNTDRFNIALLMVLARETPAKKKRRQVSTSHNSYASEASQWRLHAAQNLASYAGISAHGARMIIDQIHHLTREHQENEAQIRIRLNKRQGHRA